MNEMMKRSCPNCGTAMECKLQNFSIGADGGGGLMTLLADQYEVDLFACPQCGRVELYRWLFQSAPPRPLLVRALRQGAGGPAVPGVPPGL